MKNWTIRILALAAAIALVPACHEGEEGPPGADGSTDAWARVGNAGTVDGTNFIGTTDNVALDLRVNNLRGFRVEPATSPNVIGGFNGNSVATGAVGATVAGGGTTAGTNRVTDQFGAVGGGFNNQAGDGAGSTVDRECATVGGGNLNVASGLLSTVSGGQSNTASGARSTVPGGFSNVASGADSSAAGSRAQATHVGSFVWADTALPTFGSTAANEFSVRCSGGARFISSVDGLGAPLAGVTLAAGGGAWAAVSDRNVKANVVKVDGRETLEKLAQVPIATWNYTTQETSIRHIGPMAQDFKAAFKVGEDDRHITTVDADGVALSAIQGLYAVVKEKDAKIAALEARLDAIEKRLAGKK